MRIEYLPHAERRLALRGLPKELVEDALRNASEIRPARFGRLEALKRLDGKVLKVVFEAGEQVYMVVTAYFISAKRVKWLK